MKKDSMPEIDRLRREIKAYIASKGIDDGDLAREAGLKANTLSSFLTGTTQVPRLDFFFSLIQNTGFRPSFMGKKPAAENVEFPDGAPREIRAAVQKAVQMVEDFISVVPQEKRLEDSVKKGLFVMLVADLLIAGRQEEIADTMKDLIRAFSRPPDRPL